MSPNEQVKHSLLNEIAYQKLKKAQLVKCTGALQMPDLSEKLNQEAIFDSKGKRSQMPL